LSETGSRLVRDWSETGLRLVRDVSETGVLSKVAYKLRIVIFLAPILEFIRGRG